MDKRRADIIAEQLEEMVLDRKFADGERLDEVRLSAQFNVSRTPLREALQKLAQSGLVELLPRRGAFVRQPGPQQLIEMYEVLAELEAACGRFAAKRMTDVGLRALRESLDRCGDLLRRGETDAYYAENEVFHGLIYRAAGNAFLERETIRLHDRLRPYRRHQLRQRGRLAVSMREHERIFEALERSDHLAAAEALRDHVVVQGDKFLALLSTLGEVAPGSGVTAAQ